jgi:hypothetical protein
MWKAVAVLIVAVLGWLVASPCHADGKVFATMHHAASIPDQQAMIAWRDGVQTLAIETRFDGTGRQFAWVVPLPSVPTIEAATPGFFPTLRVIGSPNLRSVSAEIAVSLTILVVLLTILLCTWSSGFGLIRSVLVTGVLALLIVGVVLPSLGKARGTAAPPQVDVLERNVVGSYETTTITGDSAQALASWLTASGFHTPAESLPAISEYATRGWCFVACRLTRDGAGGVSSPHPLVFKFTASKPVYPLQLTATDGQPVSIELSVFGPGAAVAPGFTVQRCFQPRYEPAGNWVFHNSSAISHSAIRSLADGLPVATFLRGTLTPAQMRTDATISFKEFVAQHRVVYGRDGALNAAWTVAAVAATLGLIIAIIGGIVSWVRGRAVSRWPCWVALAVGVVAGVWVRASLPVVAVQNGRAQRWHDEGLYETVVGVMNEAGTIRHASAADFKVWARQRLAERLAGLSRGGLMVPKQEDSPGNYTLADTDEGVLARIYTREGGEVELLVSPAGDTRR